ncbi:hypothetical protein NFI96_002879 [Prochilodus magdalenae]|nr:hypothetical protein NFI96_002879 [Prochilodus magdalenae]
MERLLLNHLRPLVHHAEDPLQFAYREKVGVEDAILYLLHRAHSHLDKGGGAVRVMFLHISRRDAGRLDRLVRKAGSVLGLELESLTPLAERRALSKLLNIMDNVHHPLHTTIIRQRSSFSGRLLSQSCSTDRLRRSSVPQAIRLFSSSQYSK